MPYHSEIFLTYLIDFLSERKIEYDISDFPSGSRMIDIYYDHDFYVVDLALNKAGFSLIDTDKQDAEKISNEIFTELNSFKERFESVFR